jgi:tellurite resistance protein TerC
MDAGRGIATGSEMLLPWLIFLGFVLSMLALDLGVFHRKSHAVSFKESLGWSAVWITLGVSFSVVVYFAYEHNWFGLGLGVDEVDGMINNGRMAATKYLTGYVVEESLSMDNIFVIAMIIGSLKVPARYQHRVLFWGILGALVMRGMMIGVGVTLVHHFHWILYVFGGFLIITALKMLFMKEKEEHPEDTFLIRWIRKRFPITQNFHGQHFMVKAGSDAALEAAEPGEERAVDPVVESAPKGKWLLTPLAVALVLIEATDLIFAVDSIPAIFSITADPFLVFTSNVFAILGLRSLYFALAGMLAKFTYLKPALSLILLVVGIKMLTAKWLKLWLGDSFNLVVLGVIIGILVTGVITSLLVAPKAAEN